MNNIVNKLIIGVSLATTIAIAMPLTFMTTSVIRGESPRQIAAVEPVEDVAEDDPIENEPIQPPEDAGPVVDLKPEVQPDPGPAPQTQPEPEAVQAEPSELEATPEPVAQGNVNPPPASKSSSKNTNSQITTKKNISSAGVNSDVNSD